MWRRCPSQDAGAHDGKDALRGHIGDWNLCVPGAESAELRPRKPGLDLSVGPELGTGEGLEGCGDGGPPLAVGAPVNHQSH